MDQLFDLVADHGAEPSPPPEAATASDEFRIIPIVTALKTKTFEGIELETSHPQMAGRLKSAPP
jgi:hypothetical protein